MVAGRPAAAGRAPKPRNADLAKRRGLGIGGLGAEWPPTAKDSHAFGGKIFVVLQKMVFLIMATVVGCSQLEGN